MASSRHDRSTITCPYCRYVVIAQSARIRHVYSQHVNKCALADEVERARFKLTGRWPKAKSPITPTESSL